MPGRQAAKPKVHYVTLGTNIPLWRIRSTPRPATAEFCMEQEYFFLLPILVLVAVIAIFGWLFKRKDRLHAAEAGKRPAFTESCAGVISWVTFKGPFIRVAVYDSFIVVSCDRQYYLPFSQIMRIEPCSFLFTKGYRIHHNIAEYPKRIEVWLTGRDRFEAALVGKVNLA